MPDLKNAFHPFEKVKEWVSFTAFLHHHLKPKTCRKPHHLLTSNLFKPDIGILVISACTIKNDYFFSICMTYVYVYETHSIAVIILSRLNSIPCSLLLFYQNTSCETELLTTFPISKNTC